MKPELTTLIQPYLDDTAYGLAEATLRNKRSWMKRLDKWLKGRTTPRTDQWAEYIRKRVGPASAKVGMVQALMFFRWCERRGYVDPDQIRHVKITAPPARRQALTEPEYHQLMALATGELRGALLLAWHTGLRYHDVMTARHEWLVDSCVKLVPHKTKRLDKQVAIPLQPEVFAELSAMGDGEWLFPGLRVNHGHGDWPRQLFNRLCQQAGVKDRTFHSFRHGFITRLLEKGVAPHFIATMTGQTVQQVMGYARITPDAVREAMFGKL
jgi:integrase